jgi:Spy/CpxP family protein refolding chaperone
MKFRALALALFLAATPLVAPAQDTGLASDEQILLGKVNSDKRAMYAEYLELTDAEAAKFWPVYDDYEARIKKVDDRFLTLVNSFAEKYATLTDADAATMLKEKMAIEKERAALKQTYTKKIAKVLPARKALRYAQLETRIENLIRRNVYSLIPLVH